MATFVKSFRCLLAEKQKISKCIYLHQKLLRNSPRTFATSCHRLEKKFSDKHEWIKLEGNIGTVGISDYAQDKLGEVVYAQLPDEGTEFDQDDECGALESVKAASEIYTPVSGTITAKNTKVEESPQLINTGPYEEGWLFKIELSNVDEMSELMTEEKYNEFLKQAE